MAPTLRDGDVVILVKDTYSAPNHLPEYGDILALRRSWASSEADVKQEAANAAGQERRYRIGRVEGLPDDVMAMRSDALYRNDKAVRGDVRIPEENGIEPGTQVEGGGIFLLNDNPDDDLDSRMSNARVAMSDVRGRVVFRVWPLDRFGPIN
jgi:signal peptidase I